MSTEKIVVEMGGARNRDAYVRFAVGGEPEAEVCGKLYVQAAALERLGKPERIKLTIEPA